MNRNILFILLPIICLIFITDTFLYAEVFHENNNSINLEKDLSSKIIKNPSGGHVQLYINKMLELAPAVGRAKVAKTFETVIKKLESGEEDGKPAMQIFRLSLDELNGNYTESLKNFSIIKKWNISGPWKRYGKADVDYQFYPEKAFKIDDIEKGRDLSVEDNGKLNPYKYNHQADETIYATCSVKSSSGIIFWLLSDAGYKLIINGRVISRNNEGGKNTIQAYALKGAHGYTFQIKMQSGAENLYPYLRAMITDENHNPVQLTYSSRIYSYNFTAEKIFNLDDETEFSKGEASILTERMRVLIHSENYIDAYKIGVKVTEKYPSYLAAYREFFPLLDMMNRDDEFNASIKKFLKIFPDSDIHLSWLADFYMTRDREKFQEIMKKTAPNILSKKSVETYLYQLCGKKKYSDALALCSLMKGDPRFIFINPQVIKESGDTTLWRKMLIEGTAGQNNAYFYYSLGLLEMKLGLDPVMYWEKGSSLSEDSGLMRDLSDIYENSIIGVNDFYSGIYTDLHPEFRWNAKKRKVLIHVYESGRVVLEGEDIIPSSSKLRNKKYLNGEIEFSSGEIKAAVPYMKGLKILYVLTAKDGLPLPVNFNSELLMNNRLCVKYKVKGDEEFSVIKYSGELDEQRNVFTLVNGLVLKARDEDISELEYKIICHGNFTPFVSYRGEPLSAGKYSDGEIKFGVKDQFPKNENDSVVSVISKFQSDRVFTEWYSYLISYAGKIADCKNFEVSEDESLSGISKKLHYYIMSVISKKGDLTFDPCKMESVLVNGEGTVEERTLLAKAILENKGIKSFVAFKKNKEGLIEKILLYVPENRGSGYWLDFYGEFSLDKMESGFNAIVITGEGYETFPVNPETYIR